MKKVKVISRSSLPVRAPVLTTAVLYLLLEVNKAPGWAWGAVAVIAIILWVIFFYGALLLQEQVEFPSGKDE